MKGPISKLALFLFMTLFFGGIACEESKPGGGGTVTPSEEEPGIIEAYVCGAVRNGKAELVGTDFFPGETVFIWINWNNVAGDHAFRALWTKPNDDVVESPAQSFNSKTGKQITFASLNTTSGAQTGRWYVEIYLDDVFYGSYSFWLWDTPLE